MTTAVRVRKMRLAELVENPENPRRISRRRLDELKAALESSPEMLDARPLIALPDGRVIGGNMRLRAAAELGWERIPTVVVDLDEQTARMWALRDNAAYGEWEEPALAEMLANLDLAGQDLSLTGFSSTELDRLLRSVQAEPSVDPDAVPEVPAEPTTRDGELWALGDHLLLCGDATVPSSLDRLMGAEPARMMFTDPPWNVAIGLDSNPRHRQREGLKNDDLGAEDFQAFLSAFVTAAAPKVSGDVYCVLGASEWPRLDATLRGAGYHWSATIIWVKDVFVLGRSKYHRRYEPIWYGWAKRSSFNGARNLDDVWDPRPKASAEHPTMKPVALVQRAIHNSSDRGDVILDPFGGSGTTLIAAHLTGRRARLMELDPAYCDVIVRRWEQLTGETAERV